MADYLVTPADYRDLAGGAGLTMVLARRRPEVTRDAARAAIAGAVHDQPTVEIVSGDELRRQATAAIDPTLRFLYSLLGLAVAVGVLAGVLPARRAARVDLLRAVAVECA